MRRITIGFLVLLALAGGPARSQEPSEALKIQQLILSVERLEGAKFIRNGREHDARAAADHLRLKLKRAGRAVKTADDFIRLCGTGSSMTGEAYRIRFADGTISTAEAFFRNQLRPSATSYPVRPE